MGNSESRVFCVHVSSGKALAKYGSHTCPAEVSKNAYSGHSHGRFDNNTYSLKLQVDEKNKENDDLPGTIWIRNDAHPQRSLWTKDGSSFTWEDVQGFSYTECKWEVEVVEVKGTAYSDGLYLKHVKTQMYLGCDGKTLSLNDKPELWALIPGTGAFTPGQAVGIAAGGTLAVAGGVAAGSLAVSAGAAGAGAATAGTTAAAAATTASEAAGAAVAGWGVGTGAAITATGEAVVAAGTFATAAATSIVTTTVAVSLGGVAQGVALTGTAVAVLSACAPASSKELYVGM